MNAVFELIQANYLSNRWLLLAGSLILAYLIHMFVLRIFIRKIIYKIIKKTKIKLDDLLIDYRVIEPLSHLIPFIIVYFVIVSYFQDVAILQNILNTLIGFIIIIILNRLSELLFAAYSTTSFAKTFPAHKSYLTLIKILIFFIGILVLLALILGKSPWGIITSIGAFSAVLMFVFKDTILSFTSSVVINSNNIFKEGDWIEAPSLGIDGDVIEVGLHVIKVSQWDRTILNVPTHKLMETTVKNWKGIEEAKGRRIKRSILIDQKSIRALREDEIKTLKKVSLLKDYLHNKEKEISEYNFKLAQDCDHQVNLRRLTNIGTFRNYIVNYLNASHLINHDLALMVRQMAPTEKGLPLEVYCFTNTTRWVEYEKVQSDFFDHFLSIMPDFGLEVFQDLTGSDLLKLK
jgi:miniconductance mechanosensitive channel